MKILTNPRKAKNRFIQGKIAVATLKNRDRYRGQNKIIEFKSSMELSFVRYLDAHPHIHWWNYEETIIPYKNPIDHRMHKYFPDFRMNYTTARGTVQEAIVEIKPLYELAEKPALSEKNPMKVNEAIVAEHAINRAKWSACRTYCERNNIKFIFLTEKELMTEEMKKIVRDNPQPTRRQRPKPDDPD